MECSICLEDIEFKFKKTLKCEHVFHKKCLYPWYIRSESCPLCRTPITRYNNLMCMLCDNEIFNNFIKFDCNHYYHTRCITNVDNYNTILNCCTRINKK